VGDAGVRVARDERPFAIRHFGMVLAGFAVLLAGLAVLHLSVGTVALTPWEVLEALGGGEDALDRQIVWELRVPRVLVTLVAGAMLGLAGAVLQALTRNPLAEPGLLGVSSGAVLLIVIVTLMSTGGSLSGVMELGLLLPVVGMAGGLGAGLVVYMLSYERGGGAEPMRLILVGILVAGINSALITVLLLGARAEDVQRIVSWTMGSTAGRVWSHWEILWPVALVAIPLGLASVGWVNSLQLGDGVARGLGLRVEPVRFGLLAVSALLTAGAVSVVGAIGFIGLIGPHAARLIVWNDARRLFPLSLVLAAMLLVGADIVARTADIGWIAEMMGREGVRHANLPVGAITALLGAPFFLVLLLRGRVSL